MFYLSSVKRDPSIQGSHYLTGTLLKIPFTIAITITVTITVTIRITITIIGMITAQ